MAQTETETPDPTPEPEPEHLEADQEERIVDRVVDKVRPIIEEMKRTVLGDRGHAGPEEGGEGEGSIPPEPTSPRQIEAASEDHVRAAVDRILGERDHEEHHKHLREAEKPPQQISRITRALWGSDR